jgi:hypothetical protein
MIPIWLHVVMAFVIASLAFAIGQVMPGLGVPFVALASMIWVARSVRTGARRRATP